MSQYPSITSAEDLNKFKQMAGINMYVALAVIALAIPGILMSMYISITEGLYGFGIVLAVSMPQYLFAKY